MNGVNNQCLTIESYENTRMNYKKFMRRRIENVTTIKIKNQENKYNHHKAIKLKKIKR